MNSLDPNQKGKLVRVVLSKEGLHFWWNDMGAPTKTPVRQIRSFPPTYLFWQSGTPWADMKEQIRDGSPPGANGYIGKTSEVSNFDGKVPEGSIPFEVVYGRFEKIDNS